MLSHSPSTIVWTRAGLRLVGKVVVGVAVGSGSGVAIGSGVAVGSAVGGITRGVIVGSGVGVVVGSGVGTKTISLPRVGVGSTGGTKTPGVQNSHRISHITNAATRINPISYNVCRFILPQTEQS